MRKDRFENIIDFSCNMHLIPGSVALDVMKRMLDWLSSANATETDDYILRQLDYASKFL